MSDSLIGTNATHSYILYEFAFADIVEQDNGFVLGQFSKIL